MKMPSMTTRRWLYSIAVMAVILAAGRLWARRAAYLRLTKEHAGSEAIMNSWLREARVYENRFDPTEPNARVDHLPFDLIELKAMIDQFTVFAAYHSSLRRKYAYAAWHPWLTVPPDPPKPPGSPYWPLPIL